MFDYRATIEAQIAACGVSVEVRTIEWPRPVEQIERMPNYALCLTCTSELTRSRTHYSMDGYSGSFVDTGRLNFVPAGVYLHGDGSAGTAKGVFCVFERDWFETLTGLGHHWTDEVLSACVNIKNPRLAQAMSRLGREALEPGFASTELTNGLATMIGVELARHLRSVDAKQGSITQQLSPWQMRRIAEHVENLASYAPDIEEIADLCGVSGRHLRRLFKQTNDQTIYEYARDVWATKVKMLLRDTDLPLKEIWSQFGFASPSSFSVAFRKATGESPRLFRQRFGRPRRLDPHGRPEDVTSTHTGLN